MALCISDNDIGVDMERFRGFAAGFAPGNASLQIVPMQKESRHKFYLQHIDMLKEKTAIFAVSDYYAIDIMSFLSEKGICVPKDMSVVGFDDIPMCQMVQPSLTSVKQDGALRAKLAIEKLTQLRQQEEIDTEITLPVTLVVRNSTAAYCD